MTTHQVGAFEFYPFSTTLLSILIYRILNIIYHVLHRYVITHLTAELYEISPYATFGVSAAHSLQFRTLARRDDEAAPPHRRRHRACDHYRYGNYSLIPQSNMCPLVSTV